LYGENEDLIKYYSLILSEKFKEKNKIIKTFFEEDILKNPDHIITEYNNGSLFGDKIISIIKNCSDKILDVLNQISLSIDEEIIILNSGLLQKTSKLRKFAESNPNTMCIPCYQENLIDIKRFLLNELQQKKINLSNEQIDHIIHYSSLRRSKITEIIDKLSLIDKGQKIDKVILEDVCCEQDLQKNEEIIDILLSKNQQNINEFISNMSNYDKNYIEIIIFLRNLIIKILNIYSHDSKMSLDEKIEKYKPIIFWKEKERIKNILKIWNIKDLQKLFNNLNYLEKEIKLSNINQDIQFYYFLTENLSKKSF
jgi:DNA polymerase-3 subunit delta